jgi:hypothetical protein
VAKCLTKFWAFRTVNEKRIAVMSLYMIQHHQKLIQLATNIIACSQMHFTVQSCLGSCPAASQETTCILWNLKVHHCVHNSPALVRILNETSNNNLPPRFSKVYCNNVFHLCLCFTSGLVSSGFPTKTFSSSMQTEL